MSRVEIDLTYLSSDGVGAAGVTQAELFALAERGAAAVQKTQALHESGTLSFFDLPEKRDEARALLSWAAALPASIENLVVLGIGGSSLGARALYAALARPFDALRPRAPGGPRRLWFCDNIDPATFAAVLELAPPEKTVFYAVSKSGGTAETAAQLLVVVEHLKKTVGAARLAQHLVITTDPTRGALRRVATELGVTAFDVPPPVGGRFSVLSAVGLLPAAAAGLDVMGLLDGAATMRDRVARETDLGKNPALLLAAALHLHDRGRHRPIHVFMPYVDQLFDTALWFQQLWAESLGKARDVHGAPVHVGPTPLPARGATDQHAQVQLFVEGPDDKVTLFVSLKERADVAIPRGVLGDGEEFAYLGGRGLGELLEAERRGTQLALARAGRPSANLTLQRLDAPALGELLMLLMAATAFAGPLYGVDPYDQPGVEAGKRIAFALMGRDGYAADAPGEARRNAALVL